MDLILQFLGRLHPVVVHFPIGILFIAFFFELLSKLKKYENLRHATQPALLIGVISAVVSVITGLYLSDEGGYNDELLVRHKQLGITTAALSAAIYGFRLVAHRIFRDPNYRGKFNTVLFVPLIIIVSLTGHFGGSMTHGADYLFAAVTEAGEGEDPATRFLSIQNVDSAVLYADLVKPILESRCYSCHSSRRQKGDLRLDEIELINKGGENGRIIRAGSPDSSSLFVRLMLPLDHDDHMPPNEKPQPSSAEIALIQSWIKAGADYNIRVSATREPEKIKAYFASVVELTKKEKVLPEEEVNPADEKIIAELTNSGVIVLPVAEGSNYLSISFVNFRSISEKMLSQLAQLKSQIIWLDLARTTIADSQMSVIGQLETLRRLNLQGTAVTDQGLAAISSLPELQYLNLAGTRISDNGLKQLAAVKSLRKIFVYQTDVTDAGIREIQGKLPDVEVDAGGYSLPSLLTDSVIVEFDPK